MLEDLGRDLRFAARTLLRAPGFSIVTIASLALATGATTAIFSIVNGVLLRPLPFPSPDRLVQVSEMHRIGVPGPVLFPDLQAFRTESVSFERFSGYGLTTNHLQTENGVERLTAVVSDREFFPLLGVEAMVGRTYGENDPPTVVVISAALWDRQFRRDPSTIGKTIVLSGNRWDPVQKRSVIERREYTVLGVMPERFQFPYGASSGFPGALPESRTDMWMPDSRPQGGRLGNVTGRLKPGVTVDAAASELNVIAKRLDVSAPSPYRPTGVLLVPLVREVLGSVHRALWLLFGAVGLVLAAACANVANLLLARTIARAEEVATRAALGASPFRLVRQFLAESLLLSLAGGAAGAAIASWGLDTLVAVGSAKIPRSHEIALDWRAFAFLLIVCVATAVLFGLAPALFASRARAADAAKDSGGRTTDSARYGRMRDALVIVEVALAFVLAFGVVSVLRELNRLERTESGMTTENVLTLHLTPRPPDRDYFAIEERVKALPGVRGAGLIQMVPLQNWGWVGDFRVRNRPPAEPRGLVELRTVTPGYFDALGIPLRRGRGFTEADSSGAPMILINESLANKHFPGEDPVGIETDRGTIIGIVGDVRQTGLDRPATPEIYQVVGQAGGIATDLGMSLMVRTQSAPEAMVVTIRAAVRDVSPALAIFNVKTMKQVIADSLWELNLYRWIIGLFAALALTLAAIGLYGVIAYSVSSRTREFAVRLALGSEPFRLARHVLGRGLRLTGAGVAGGLAAALSLALVARNLPIVLTAGPITYAAIAAFMLWIALAACLVPALRVTRVDPARALRHN